MNGKIILDNLQPSLEMNLQWMYTKEDLGGT